jgi:GT2 family glycosyltransferase
VLDGSTDDSATMLGQVAPRFPVPLRFAWQENRGLAAARNACIADAHNDIVWLLDDDMIVTRTALDRHLYHRRDPEPILMGPCDVASDDADVQRATWWYAERYQRLATEGSVRNPSDESFANTSAPASLFRDHPFDERFRGYGIEDFELAVRLLDAGEVIAFDSAAAVLHDFGPSRREVLGKRRSEGVNRVLFTELHPGRDHVVFGSTPGHAERIFRGLAKAPLGGPLWLLAKGLDRAASSRIGRRRRAALMRFAEHAATYSGVAWAGTAHARRRRALTS